MRHQVDALRAVLDPHMDVHAADQHASGHAHQFALKLGIAVLDGEGLVLPVREGVAGDRDGGEVMPGGLFGDAGAQVFEILARLGHGFADLGADLDLALQEFGADLILQFGLAGSHQGLGAAAR